jgi:integrase
MRVRLKGLNSIRKKLADGSFKTYWYAWKSGPPLRGEPGTPEFIASYNEAATKRRTPPEGTLQSIFDKFQQADVFLERRPGTGDVGLAKRTRDDYTKIIAKTLEPKFGTFPLAGLTEAHRRKARGVFLEWRDELARRSRRQADYAWTVFARILSWAKDRGYIETNPCERGGRLYRASRTDKVWTADDEANFLKKASAHLHLPLMLAIWTGQRQGDLLALPWSAYDGSHIRLRQSKTGARVVIPVGAPLKAMLDKTKKQSTVILVNSDGQPWTPDGFRVSWRKACAKAGVVGVTFHDLRGTAVSRLALAGCTDMEIATMTGLSLKDVHAILDAHYLNRDPALAEAAVRKLESRTKSPN